MSAPALLNRKNVELLRDCDFFSGDSDSFASCVGGEPWLCWGVHKDPPPLVSLVIPTYNRPQWLKLALESALSQEGVDDYEVVIVDNEGVDVCIETDTSRLVRLYSDEKIVYYRHKKSVENKMDSAVSCARTQFFVILHDDDVISKVHLKVLIEVLKANPGIFYLGCTATSFSSENQEEAVASAMKNVHDGCSSLRKYTAASSGISCMPGWLGALIDREKYIGIGGMCGKLPIPTGINDFIMVIKFMARYGPVYHCLTAQPLYYYRESSSQSSASGGHGWTSNYISEFLFYNFLNRKYHPMTAGFWNYLSSVAIYEKIEDRILQQRWVADVPISLDLLYSLANLPVRNIKSVRFRLEKKLLALIRCCYLEGFCGLLKRKLKRVFRCYF